MTLATVQGPFRRTAGTGPRRAVMLHCALSHSAAWGGVARRLGRHLSMTMPDLPGHGRNGPWTGGGAIEAEVARTTAVLCDGPTDLIGHSFGAVAMLRLALDRPDLCRSLVLVEPVLFAVSDAPEVAAYFRRIAPFKAALARGDRAAAAEMFNAIWGALPWRGLTDAQRQEQIDRIDVIDQFAPCVEDDRSGLCAPGRLEGLDVPVLLLEGSASPPVVAAIHDALEARLPRVTRRRIDGARHMLPISHPGQVARAIAGFLSLE